MTDIPPERRRPSEETEDLVLALRARQGQRERQEQEAARARARTPPGPAAWWLPLLLQGGFAVAVFVVGSWLGARYLRRPTPVDPASPSPAGVAPTPAPSPDLTSVATRESVELALSVVCWRWVLERVDPALDARLRFVQADPAAVLPVETGPALAYGVERHRGIDGWELAALLDPDGEASATGVLAAVLPVLEARGGLPGILAPALAGDALALQLALEEERKRTTPGSQEPLVEIWSRPVSPGKSWAGPVARRLASLATNPALPELRVTRILVLLAGGSPESAASELLALGQSKVPVAWKYFASGLLRRCRYLAAEKAILETIVAQKDSLAPAHFRLGDLARARGDRDQALNHFRQAHVLSVADPRLRRAARVARALLEGSDIEFQETLPLLDDAPAMERRHLAFDREWAARLAGRREFGAAVEPLERTLVLGGVENRVLLDLLHAYSRSEASDRARHLALLLREFPAPLSTETRAALESLVPAGDGARYGP